jgi:hypothetical protein
MLCSALSFILLSLTDIPGIFSSTMKCSYKKLSIGTKFAQSGNQGILDFFIVTLMKSFWLERYS